MFFLISQKLTTIHNKPRTCAQDTDICQSKFTYINHDRPQGKAPPLNPERGKLDLFLEMSLALDGNRLSHTRPFSEPTSDLFPYLSDTHPWTILSKGVPFW